MDLTVLFRSYCFNPNRDGRLWQPEPRYGVGWGGGVIYTIQLRNTVLVRPSPAIFLKK